MFRTILIIPLLFFLFFSCSSNGGFYIYDLNGNRVCVFGDKDEGEGAGQFIAPHGIAVDSHGDIYVAEVSYTIRGSHMDPPRELRSFSKYSHV